jgi:hypothetical protein
MDEPAWPASAQAQEPSLKPVVAPLIVLVISLAHVSFEDRHWKAHPVKK